MVNKLDLNNELITLRKLFGKAQVRTINQLTKKLKVIEHGKKKDPTNAPKLDTKAAKFVEELKVLKQAKNLDMVKKVFICKDDPKKILKLQKVTAEQKAISRLLTNQFLVDAIAVAKKKLDISDEDEEWKQLLFAMGKNKKKKLKKEKLESAGTPGAAAPEPAKPSLEKKSAPKKSKPKKTGDQPDQVKDAKAAAPKDRKQKFDMKRKQFMKPKGAPGSKPPPSADKPAPAKEAAPKKDPPKSKPPTSPPKKVNIMKMESDGGGENRKPKRDFGDSKPRFNNGPRRDFGDSKPRFNNGPRRDFGDSKPRFNNGPRRDFGDSKPRFNNGPRKDFKPRGEFGDKPKRDFGPKGGQEGGKPQFSKSKTTGDKMHPSWEAKMQKKPAISEFKGKKTTFAE